MRSRSFEYATFYGFPLSFVVQATLRLFLVANHSLCCFLYVVFLMFSLNTNHYFYSLLFFEHQEGILPLHSYFPFTSIPCIQLSASAAADPLVQARVCPLFSMHVGQTFCEFLSLDQLIEQNKRT